MTEREELFDATFAVVSEINRVICEAIVHGGDPGGAYFCNYDDLHSWLKNLAISLSSLSGYPIMVVDTYGFDGRKIKKFDGEEWKVPMLEVAV